ncbi:UDP-glycosyltransferase 90A1 [Jatropha curcas]|nr:UDP-glycosyltransferase 90A1 [Jatropha curcas]
METEMDSLPGDSKYHVVLFPFMAKGHTIPLLYLARLLLNRHVKVTIFTTPANHYFIAKSLSNTTASIIDLSFPKNTGSEMSPGIESTDQLPSTELFPSFALSTKLMQPEFERALRNLPFINFMVSDGFLWWTLESAIKFGFPRLVFFGMSNHSLVILNTLCMGKAVNDNKLFSGPESVHDLITVTPFPWLKVTKSDFEPFFYEPNPKGDFFELVTLAFGAAANSQGYIMNSFYELEPVFIDYLNSSLGQPTIWCVGPLCLAEPEPDTRVRHQPDKKRYWIQWLDQKLKQGRSVLYIAFGTQAKVSSAQLTEIANGLEESKVNFLWVIRETQEAQLEDGFEERIKERGIIVKEWVDQREILKHKSVEGFLSHCGWNSVLESICAGVPILAWPMIAEQPLNARMVVEEIKVGLRVETCDGSVREFVTREGLVKMVKELMEGEMGKKVREKMREVAAMAKGALENENGSSSQTLDMLIHKTFARKIYIDHLSET